MKRRASSVQWLATVLPFVAIVVDDVSAFRSIAPYQSVVLPLTSSSSTALCLATSSTATPSAAAKWMEEETRIEDEMDRSAAASASAAPTAAPKTTSGRTWEEIHGNYILRPASTMPPRALLHFLGGAFLGAAPQLTYRYLLERLSSRGYLIVATPYQLSFDHLKTCDEVIGKFELVAPDLARQYGAVPVVGVGHSCGALLHMLITSLFPDTPRAANALISYNNRPVSEAIPVFEELVVPLFSDEERNGSRLIKAAIEVTRQQINGQVPSDDILQQLVQSLPSPLPGVSLTSLLPPSLIFIPTPVRELLTTVLTRPVYEVLSNTPFVSGNIPSFLLQSLDVTMQIPKLIDEVQGGARDFYPTPQAMSSAARRVYRCRRTLLLQFENDALDDSVILEGYLREAESVMRMKRPMVSINLERRVLEGNHLTPLLGPSGGETWGAVLEDTLGGIVGIVDGVSGGGGSGNDEDDASSAKVVRERLGYEQVEKVVDALVAWLDDGSL